MKTGGVKGHGASLSALQLLSMFLQHILHTMVILPHHYIIELGHYYSAAYFSEAQSLFYT